MLRQGRTVRFRRVVPFLKLLLHRLLPFGQERELVAQGRALQFHHREIAPQHARIIRQHLRQFGHDLLPLLEQIFELLRKLFVHFGNLPIVRIDWVLFATEERLGVLEENLIQLAQPLHRVRNLLIALHTLILLRQIGQHLASTRDRERSLIDVRLSREIVMRWRDVRLGDVLQLKPDKRVGRAGGARGQIANRMLRRNQIRLC